MVSVQTRRTSKTLATNFEGLKGAGDEPEGLEDADDKLEGLEDTSDDRDAALVLASA